MRMPSDAPRLVWTISGLTRLQTIRDITDRAYYLEHAILRGAAPSLIREWAKQANEALDRREQGGENGGAAEPPRGNYEAKVGCNHCGEQEAANASSGTVICGTCAATVDTPDYKAYMLQWKAEWKRQTAEMELQREQTSATEGREEGATGG